MQSAKKNIQVKIVISIIILFMGTSKANAQSTPVTFNISRNALIPHSNKSLPLVEPHIAVNPKNANHMVVTAIVFDSAAPTTTGDHIVAL